MRRIALRTAFVVGAGLAVLAVVLWVATTVDARPPAVATYRLTHPLPDDERRALITTSIEIEFSEPVDQTSAERALTIRPALDGALSWSGTTLTFTPAAPLPLETAFEVRVGAGVRDEAGNRMTQAATPFRFQTAGRPELVESEPADGADDVPVTASVSLVFSTFMDTASVERGLTVTPAFRHELRWSGERLELVPVGPLRPNQRYRVRIEASAADVAGVTLQRPATIEFRTTAAELEVASVVPADGTAGVSPMTPIGIFFDLALDPESVTDEGLQVVPDVSGTLEVIPSPGSSDSEELRLLRFTPSTPLPPNTTFEVELATGLRSLDGGQLAAPVRWRFTTGAPPTTLGNQIVFLSARSGVTNVWTMNPDGTGQRQLSAELAPVTDYAVAPDGRTLVVGDGRTLIQMRADGSERRLLTDEGVIEFDPTFSPDGSQLAFGRADERTGSGLGLWRRAEDGGDLEPIQPRGPAHDATPGSASPTDGEPIPLLRAPRFSPDGAALAFVDAAGWIGIVDLESGRVARAPFHAVQPPIWLADGGGILVSGMPSGASEEQRAAGEAVAPLDPATAGLGADELASLVAVQLRRSSSELAETALGTGAARLTLDAADRILLLRLGTRGASSDGGELIAGRLELTEGTQLAPRVVAGMVDRAVVDASFGPEPGDLVVALSAGDETTQIAVTDFDGVPLRVLSPDGSRPRWLP